MAGVYKRSSTYWARAQRHGREYRESLRTRDRRVAERRLREWLERLDALAWGERPRITFNEASKQFVIDHCSTLKPKSAMRYGVSLRWLSRHYEGKFLDEIDRQTMAEFETWRRSIGVSAPTIRRDLMCLSSILTMCEDRDWIEEGKNPIPGYLRRRAKRGLKESPPRTRYLTHREEEMLLQEAQNYQTKIKTSKLPEAIMLSIDSGLREQELLSLKWPQIDLCRNVIVTTNDTKSRRVRMVPIAPRSAQFLAQWKVRSIGSIASLYVFSHDNGSRYRTLHKSFRKCAENAGIQDIRWHDLRRTAGCRWLQDQERRLEEVQILLGHSSIDVTERCYAFLDAEKVATETAAQKQAQGMRTGWSLQ